MRAVITLAVASLAAAVTVPRYFAQTSAVPSGPPAHAMMAAHPAPVAASTPADSRSVIVPRDHRGHFEVDGRVDGRHLKFMVDTGASVIALTASDAATLGIHPANREFAALIRTANGTVRGAPITLNMVEIQDIMLRDVAAMVLPDGALSDNLLGLSFLSRLRRFEYAEGRLVLEQ